MNKSIPLPIEGYDHLVDPPIVDFLHHDLVRHAYVVTFVPDDTVSHSETEVVEIPEYSSDGRRVAWQLEALANLWKPALRIERIVHSGGGDFEFHFEGGKVRRLSADDRGPGFALQAYHCLTDMAMSAEFTFIDKQRTSPAKAM